MGFKGPNVTVLQRVLPILRWAPDYQRTDLRSDLAAGVTVGAMLVPQAMAYALLAGLPPAVGLYAATVPVLVYAVFGTSRQLAVGPVAIVSLLTATALAPLVEEGTAGYLAAAAVLALLVGAVHLVLGAARLGKLVNVLSHSVLVGFTAAAAVIIGFSQAKHLLGISIERREHFYETVGEVAAHLGDVHWPTLVLGAGAVAALLALKRLAPKVPAALAVVAASIALSELLDLEARGVAVVGSIPDSLPAFGLPDFDGTLVGDLVTTAFVITVVGFMESIAVAKVYARRHRYDVEPNQELIGLGAANLASGLFGGYPVTGGFSRTAVNDSAGARTPLASIVTAGIVLVTIAVLTPLLSSLPTAALGAIIVMAVVSLVDVAEMRHIAAVKRSDLIGLSVAFVATLALGIEIGIVVAVVASMLVVFARMSTPHAAVLGRIAGTTAYRNTDRFPEAETVAGVRVIRIDAALSFVNAANVKKLLLAQAQQIDDGAPRALVLDASGINDLDVTGVEMLHEVLADLNEPDAEGHRVELHLADVKGPVRDVLRRAGIWAELDGRIHTDANDAVAAVSARRPAPTDQRRHGIDERPTDLSGGRPPASGPPSPAPPPTTSSSTTSSSTTSSSTTSSS
ncbi:MAG: solute carrier family 26 protein, partial [Acidimicrobiia bacterium]|nr:solute carrier family 26 protein [Acidimicrobiia bacterium]